MLLSQDELERMRKRFVYPRFSAAEYERRYGNIRRMMRHPQSRLPADRRRFCGIWALLVQFPLRHEHDGQGGDGELLLFPERG